MRYLPFADNSFAEVTHLWCLYHLEDPVAALLEARRMLRTGGRYYACTAARNNDPEIMPDGYTATTFDAEEALAIVASVFPNARPERWDESFFPLQTRDEVRAYCRHNLIPAERAENCRASALAYQARCPDSRGEGMTIVHPYTLIYA